MRYNPFMATRSDNSLPFRLARLDHVVIMVADMDRAIAFWSNALGAQEERRIDKIGLVQMRAGDSLIDLVPRKEETGRNVEHICLQVEPWDEAAIRDHLMSRGIEAGPAERRYGAQGYGPSIYLDDPEGNTIELKGPPEGSG